MEIPSTLCCAQEAIQRHRATSAALENVRMVAAKAAVTWGLEAVAAEHREARHARTRAIAELMDIKKRRSHHQLEAMLNENPDRSFAQP